VVKRISNADLWDLRSAVSDPTVVGIVTMSHGHKGELNLAGSELHDPWGPAPHVTPYMISEGKTSIVSPSLKFALIIGCDALQLGDEWSMALKSDTALYGAEVIGYDYEVPWWKVSRDDPLYKVFEEYGIIENQTRYFHYR
jgi:hypothetical protein